MRASEELSDISADAPNSLRQANDADGIMRLQIIVLQKLPTNTNKRLNCMIRPSHILSCVTLNVKQILYCILSIKYISHYVITAKRYSNCYKI